MVYCLLPNRIRNNRSLLMLLVRFISVAMASKEERFSVAAGDTRDRTITDVWIKRGKATCNTTLVSGRTNY